MLVFDPEQRISIDDALAHPFLTRVRAARKHVCEFSAPTKLRMRHRLRKMSIEQIRDTFAAEFMIPGRWDGLVPAADRQHVPSRPLPPAPPGSVQPAPASSGRKTGRHGRITSIDMVVGAQGTSGSSGVGGGPLTSHTATDSEFRDIESPSQGSRSSRDGARTERLHSDSVDGPLRNQIGAAQSGTAGLTASVGGSSRSVARATAEAYLRRRGVDPGNNIGRGGAHHAQAPGTGAAGGVSSGGANGRTGGIGAHIGAGSGARAPAPKATYSDDEDEERPVRRVLPAGRAAKHGTQKVAGALHGSAGASVPSEANGTSDDDEDDEDEFFDAVDEDADEDGDDHGEGGNSIKRNGHEHVSGSEFPAGTEPRTGHTGHMRAGGRGGPGESGSGSGFYNAVDDSVQEAQSDEYWARAQKQLDDVLLKVS